jgi:hypothetical protein
VDRRTDAKRQAQDEQMMRLRLALNNAYASLRGRAVADSFAAYTIEEAIDAHVDVIEGKGTKVHPSQLDRVERIRNDLIAVAEAIKALPVDSFRPVDDADAVNTPTGDAT